MTHIYNRADQKDKRQQLRRARPLAERLLWLDLRDEQMGVKFRRQYSVGPFVLDFYCPQLKLAIEIDGPTHDETAEDDARRQDSIEVLGIQFLRFSNAQIYNDREAVRETIAAKIPRT